MQELWRARARCGLQRGAQHLGLAGLACGLIRRAGEDHNRAGREQRREEVGVHVRDSNRRASRRGPCNAAPEAAEVAGGYGLFRSRHRLHPVRHSRDRGRSSARGPPGPGARRREVATTRRHGCQARKSCSRSLRCRPRWPRSGWSSTWAPCWTWSCGALGAWWTPTVPPSRWPRAPTWSTARRLAWPPTVWACGSGSATACRGSASPRARRCVAMTP
mmetsp:Transcript_59265/g.139883  ORF Transcript_59265/g.139883 Transcript_59265/m.139883 type:complete len:218 (+) Transcript_59265:1033-1686(+)